LSLADHLIEACSVSGISGRKCSKQKKTPQPNVWGVHFASLGERYPLAELQTDCALVAQLFIWGKKSFFPAIRKKVSTEVILLLSVKREACKLLLHNHKEDRI